MKEQRLKEWKVPSCLWRSPIPKEVVLAGLIAFLAGCGTPTVEKDPRIEALTRRLGQIETVHLEDQSKSEPLSIEQATKEVVEEISEPNKARPTVELALEEVRAAALTNNLDLKVELVEPSIAQKTLDAERAKFESTFFLAARHPRTEAPDNAGVSTSDSYEGGIEVPLHTGGSVSLNVPTSNAEGGGAGFGGLSEAAVSASYVQSLLRGAGTAVNTYSIRMASHQKDIVDAGTKLVAINILANADIAYWRLFVAHRQLQVRREQYKLAQNQLDHARRKVRAGAAPQNEIIRAEAGLSGRLEGVLNAETQLRNCERDLKAIMNRSDMPVDSPTLIVTTTQPNPLGLDLDRDAMAKAALENRMEMVQVELGLAIDDLNIKLARNTTLPALRFDYTHTLANESSSVGRAVGQLANDPSREYSLSFRLRFPSAMRHRGLVCRAPN